MNLLDANDQPGEYPASWYAHSTPMAAADAPLTASTQCQVCVIGAGYSGLSCALYLAEQGVDVVLLDAQRVGWGASGRNGGQLGSGQRLDQPDLEALLGREAARRMWQLSEDAKTLVKDRIQRYQIDCDITPGILHADHRQRYSKQTRAFVEHLQQRYNYDAIRYIERSELRDMLGSADYYSGALDMGAAHLHPLKLALGLAQACRDAGVRVFEQTRVTQLQQGGKPRVVTQGGTVQANHVVLACNGYLGRLNAGVAARVMPINNYIIATEPLSETQAKALIRDDVAVCDSRFVVNYFRLSADRRLLFGGRESYGYRFPQDIKQFVRPAMLTIYPQLHDTRIDFGWGGTLAITRNRMPHFSELSPRVLSISGYSGHGVAMANLAGMLAGKRIVTPDQSPDFDLMASVPISRFPGGYWLRWPLLVLGMLYYSARDRI